MKKLTSTFIALSFVFVWACGPSQTTETKTEEEKTAVVEEEKEEASVHFVSPQDGDTVSSPFVVRMGVKGMQIEPAGEVNEGFGHHHILVNMTGWPEGEVIPPTDSTVHYGKGQTATDFTLEPGDYTLSLQFADGVHRSYGESMAASIKITVQ